MFDLGDQLNEIKESLNSVSAVRKYGKVIRSVGTIVEGVGIDVNIGDVCEITSAGEALPIKAEVVGFNNGIAQLSPFGPINGVGSKSLIRKAGNQAKVKVGPKLLGRVIDGLGNPIDDKGVLIHDEEYPLYADTMSPLLRERITEVLDVGVRAINGLLTLGKGQRVGIFAGSGVGKSTLLGMIARNTTADVNVIALIGERGREVREFIEKDLGEEGLSRSVVVVATSDQAPPLRIRGAYLATTIAEYFRDKGKDVILMMDSATRFAMAAREVGLSSGEPPTTKGYTPSVFAHLPKLLERAGNTRVGGSITGIYTVLVEGDDFDEPIADTMRSILDGHIVLSRQLAHERHYPAIDILQSISRLAPELMNSDHSALAGELIRNLAIYKNSEDMIKIGAYVKGSNPETDRAISLIGKINEYLKQNVDEACDFSDTLRMLKKVFE